MIPTTLTVIIKDEERRLTSKFLLYEKYFAHPTDEIVKRCVAEACRSFEGEPDDVSIKIAFDI